MPRDLKGKVIVITGASSGIGAATAVKCATFGMDVVLAARNHDKLIEVADRIETFGRAAHVVPCDVNDDGQVRDLFASSWDRFGRLDAAFANAGYGLFKPVLDTTDDEYRAIFDTNFFGTLRTLRHATPDLLRTPDGLKHLLVCSSSASELGIPYFGAYCATKASQDCIAGALRGELEPDGVTVTSVHPVGTKTDFFDAAAKHSETADGGSVQMNTPDMFTQSPERVATWIGRALMRPRPEVWPSSSSRWLIAAGTALPRVTARFMRKHASKVRRGQRGADSGRTTDPA